MEISKSGEVADCSTALRHLCRFSILKSVTTELDLDRRGEGNQTNKKKKQVKRRRKPDEAKTMAISRTSVRRPEDTEGAGHTASALERAFEKAGWTLFDDDDDDGHLLLEGEDEDVRFAAGARDRGGQESDDDGSDIIDDTDEDTEGDVLRDLRAALEKGLVSREEHDEALRRILRPAMLLRAAAATTTGATDLALLAAIAGPESVQAEDPPTSPAKRPKVTASFPSSPTSVLRKQEPPLWQDDDKPTLLQPDATIRRK